MHRTANLCSVWSTKHIKGLSIVFHSFRLFPLPDLEMPRIELGISCIQHIGHSTCNIVQQYYRAAILLYAFVAPLGLSQCNRLVLLQQLSHRVTNMLYRMCLAHCEWAVLVRKPALSRTVPDPEKQLMEQELL